MTSATIAVALLTKQKEKLLMRLLRTKDYYSQIQQDNLEQVIENDELILKQVEQAAQAEMVSYLTQRYEVSNVFTDTTEFSIDATYYGKNLIEYTAPEYSTGTTYSAYTRIVYNDLIYKSIGATTGGTFNTSEWEYITPDKTLYYAKLNASEYVHTTTYSLGDVVWYNSKTYTALTNSIVSYVPSAYPALWGTGTDYTFSGHFPEETTYWQQGDNRNALLCMFLADLVLYHLHCRINPQNVPISRLVRYDGNTEKQTGGAIGWLKKIAAGELNADLPEILPVQGNRFSWGSPDITSRLTY